MMSSRVAGKSETHWVSPEPLGYAGSRERLAPLAATYKIKVRKKSPVPAVEKLHFNPTFVMWVGECTCTVTWQFHFFGATLGYGLEHLRRHHV